jgi:putative ABC transport system ATP-binding protein
MLRQSNKDLGQTILMITHNPEAAAYGDRIIHMRDGEIVTADEDPQWSPHLNCEPLRPQST